VSNFEYLLALNAASGCSWGDLTQYPIMPWVMRNYAAKQLDLADRANFRDHSLLAASKIGISLSGNKLLKNQGRKRYSDISCAIPRARHRIKPYILG
jgi:hypothetical protein